MNLVNFTKEGKGVDKNEQDKPAIVKYFNILWQKRFKLIAANLLYLLFSLPVLAVTAFGLLFITSLSMSLAGMGDLSAWINGNNGANADTLFRLFIFGFLMITCVPIMSMGPAFAGTTYLTKSFVKGEPVFTWTDFSTKMRSNLKLGLKAGLINGIIGAFLIVDAVIYMALINGNSAVSVKIPSFILFVAAILIIFGFALFFMMNIYTYQMIVTFKITLKQLYKNAFIFALIRWLPNLGILIVDALLIAIPLFLIPGAASFFVTGIMYIFFLPALIIYTNNFYAYPVIKKYLIDNPEADKSDGDHKTDKLPDFVPTENMQRFVNGRYISDEEWAELQKENGEKNNEKN